MFACQWREFSPPLSSAHRLLQCYHNQWEIGDAAIPGEFPPQPPDFRAISQWARSLEWRHAVTLHILVGKICISFFLFYCEGMLLPCMMTLWSIFRLEHSKGFSFQCLVPLLPVTWPQQPNMGAVFFLSVLLSLGTCSPFPVDAVKFMMFSTKNSQSTLNYQEIFRWSLLILKKKFWPNGSNVYSRQ